MNISIQDGYQNGARRVGRAVLAALSTDGLLLDAALRCANSETHKFRFVFNAFLNPFESI